VASSLAELVGAAVFSAVAMGGVAPLSAHADDVASSAVTVTSKQQDASLDDAPMRPMLGSCPP